MPHFVKARSFLRNLLSSGRMEADLDEEVHSHLEMLTEENIRAGMPPEDAQRAARIELGGIEQVKEQVREERIGNWLHSVLSDCRYGLRMLRKNPGFAAIAILTLAMGIGANTAIFSVVQGVVLAPLPYPDPDRLVLIRENNPALQHLVWVSYPDFLDWQRNARSFQQITALRWEQYNLTSPGTPEHLNGKAVSTGFFNTLGLKLSLGREFAPREDQQGGAPVVIISDRLWRDRFHGSAEALGKSVALDGVAYTIVGVASAGFRFEDESDIYVPAGQGNPLLFNDRTIPIILCVARLKAGVTVAQAVAELGDSQPIYNVQTMEELISQSMSAQRFPMILLGAFACLALSLASVGIYGVISYSVAQRVHEIGIRKALGAENADIFRMVIDHGLRLALTSLAIGTAAALILTRLLSSFSHLLYGVKTSDPATFMAISLLLIGVALLACYIPAHRAHTWTPWWHCAMNENRSRKLALEAS